MLCLPIQTPQSQPQLSAFPHRSVLCSVGFLQRISLEDPGCHTLSLLPPEGCTSALMSHFTEAPPLLQQEHTHSVVYLTHPTPPRLSCGSPLVEASLELHFYWVSSCPYQLFSPGTVSVRNACTKSLSQGCLL